jgi:hypothetical protein
MLSDVAIRKTKPAAKPVKLFDERGLYLLLTPAGGKLWRLAVKDPNDRAYNRTSFLLERTEMMQQWADFLDGLKHGHLHGRKAASNVPSS